MTAALIRASMLAAGLAVAGISIGRFLSPDMSSLPESDGTDWGLRTFASLLPLDREAQARVALESTSKALTSPSRDNSRALALAEGNVSRALQISPIQPEIWLASARLSFQRADKSSAIDSLKMSYLTGQHEMSLVESRLRLVIRFSAFTDSEVRDFARRDVRTLFQSDSANGRLKSLLFQAPPTGKTFLEETVREIDQNALSSFR